jgi:hypothetical protein
MHDDDGMDNFLEKKQLEIVAVVGEVKVEEKKEVEEKGSDDEDEGMKELVEVKPKIT